MSKRAIVLVGVFGASVALACWDPILQSVHFKGNNVDFGLPPIRRDYQYNLSASQDSGPWNVWRPGTEYNMWSPDDGEYVDPEKVEKEAFSAEQNRRYGDALAIYRKYEALGPEDLAFVRGRIELLSTPGIGREKGLDTFLTATRSKKPLSLEEKPTYGKMVRAWIAYEKAKTAADYVVSANRYPQSSRAPAALITAARMLSKSGATAEHLGKARTIAGRLVRQYPTSRFAWEASGIEGRIDYLQGRYVDALGRYEAQFKAAQSTEQEERAIQSVIQTLQPGQKLDAMAFAYLRWFRVAQTTEPYTARRLFLKTVKRFGAKDAPAFYARLSKSPADFSAYLDLRSQVKADGADMLAMANAARRATARTPYRGHVDGLLARTALIREDARAARYAKDALRGQDPDDRAMGEFVLASLARKKGDLRGARDGFARLVRSYPKSFLVPGARENLALMTERLGDLQGALDQYLALDYDLDVAYLTDARMTTAQVEEAIRRHPKEKTFRYTLAMRYLRLAKWDDAERTLKGLTTKERHTLTSQYTPWNNDGSIQDPMATLRALRKLDLAVKTTKGEPHAAALLAMGDYYYQHRCLLLYSGPAWRGGRDMAFSYNWNATVATSADTKAKDRHYAEHECYAQALTRYREVVKSMPESKVAQLAAYRAGVAAQRLANMSEHWREPKRHDTLLAEAVNLMRFAAKSPNKDLAAKATKYAGVFERERKKDRTAFNREVAQMNVWRPNW